MCNLVLPETGLKATATCSIPTGMNSRLFLNGFVCCCFRACFGSGSCFFFVFSCFFFFNLFWLVCLVCLFVLIPYQNLGFVFHAFSNSNPCKYVALFLESSVASSVATFFCL